MREGGGVRFPNLGWESPRYLWMEPVFSRGTELYRSWVSHREWWEEISTSSLRIAQGEPEETPPHHFLWIIWSSSQQAHLPYTNTITLTHTQHTHTQLGPRVWINRSATWSIGSIQGFLYKLEGTIKFEKKKSEILNKYNWGIKTPTNYRNNTCCFKK